MQVAIKSRAKQILTVQMHAPLAGRSGTVAKRPVSQIDKSTGEQRIKVESVMCHPVLTWLPGQTLSALPAGIVDRAELAPYFRSGQLKVVEVQSPPKPKKAKPEKSLKMPVVKKKRGRKTT
jgi:hypothetical protein